MTPFSPTTLDDARVVPCVGSFTDSLEVDGQ